MKVAVLLLQHSQWLGHLALWQTVWSLSSSSSARVRLKPWLTGSWKRSHAGRRGRACGGGSVVFTLLLLKLLPEYCQFAGVEVSQNLAVRLEDRGECLAG